MTQSTSARHRDDRPASTPLTGFTENLASKLTGRAGLALALSAGLVAPLPASELQATAHAADATGSLPVVASAEVLASAPVEAPPAAAVRFEHSAFRAKPKHLEPELTPVEASRRVVDISRSLARTAYRAATAPRHKSAAPVTSVRVPASSSRGAAVVAIASRYLGVPYVYGGTSPRGFDCSGLTQYVYRQLGVNLPRTAAQQYGATTHIPRSQARPGDLVFFFSGGSVGHVGIYLGGNMMIAAPHTGDVVKKETIYSANVAFGRA